MWDGLANQRLDTPYIRENGKLRPASWGEAFAAIKARLGGMAGEKIAALAGDLAPVEAMAALRDLMARLGSANLDCRVDGAKLPAGNRAGYVFNGGVASVDQADGVLLIGCDPRAEMPVFNARLRRAWLRGAEIGVIGQQADLTYDHAYLGAGRETLADVVDTEFYRTHLAQAKNPLIIVGMGALTGDDGAAVLGVTIALADHIGAIREDWTRFGVLHTAAARVGGMEIGFTPGEGGKDRDAILAGCASGEIAAVYALGVDEIEIPAGPFVIYQGSHGDRGAHRADVILPGAAYPEKSATYVNTEGRVQMAMRAAFPASPMGLTIVTSLT